MRRGKGGREERKGGGGRKGVEERREERGGRQGEGRGEAGDKNQTMSLGPSALRSRKDQK